MSVSSLAAPNKISVHTGCDSPVILVEMKNREIYSSKSRPKEREGRVVCPNDTWEDNMPIEISSDAYRFDGVRSFKEQPTLFAWFGKRLARS